MAGLGDNAGISDSIGQMEMMSKDTARFTNVAYGRKQALTNPLEMNTIWVMTGTVKFTGPDDIVVSYTINVYPASADDNGDGYPDQGQAPISFPGVLPIQGVDPAKRVPIWNTPVRNAETAPQSDEAIPAAIRSDNLSRGQSAR